jgi:hypothetical protein
MIEFNGNNIGRTHSVSGAGWQATEKKQQQNIVAT